MQPTTLDEVKPSNIRKRNFGATFLDAVDKEKAEKLSDINDLPASLHKSGGVKPWEGLGEGRAAISRGLAREADKERFRLAVKTRSKPDGAGPGVSSPDTTDQPRGRIRLRGSFPGIAGIYHKGLATTRKPRLEEDLPQRPDKRERNRNLRIRRPFISVLPETERTTTTTTSRPVTVTTPTSVSTSVFQEENTQPASSSRTTTEKIINLKGIVKEYKEIVRTVSSTPNSVKAEEVLDVGEGTTISESTTRTVSRVSSSAPPANVSSSINNEAASTKSSVTISESLPKEDSSENVITTPKSSFEEKLTAASSTTSKSQKQSIQSAAPSTTASLTVTESKESPGSDIKQSKTHIQQVPSLFQIDTTTRNTIERERPREELQKHLLEAIRRKISRNKATQATTSQADNEGRNLISSTKPPFFRPLPSRKNNLNSSESRVQIFLNLPNKKQAGSSVKIPNISHLRDKIERLNDAITEGLKLERLREEEEAAIEADWQKEESSVKTVETKSSSVKIISHSRDENQNKEIIRKQLFASRGDQGTGIKNQFDETTTTTVPSSSSSSTTPIPATRSTATTTRKPTTVKSSKSGLKDSNRKKLFSEHPSSHFRPDNWTRDFIPMPKSNLPLQEDVRQFVAPPRPSLETPASQETAEPSVETDNIASTALYVVGVIALIPMAGLVAWVVRTVLRRKVITDVTYSGVLVVS